ncbi:MAG: N-acetylmuramoyl-L-alanine amidase, partial [Blastocatellia bacterium]|nr:N-acetylmuramoyl-L-alanine amidase [Blastocatellia bacterium]
MSRKILQVAALFLTLAISSNPTAQVAQSQARYQEITVALQDFVGANVRTDSSGVTLTEATDPAFAMTPELVVPLLQAEPFLAVAPIVNLKGTEDGLSLLYRTQQNQNSWIEWTEIQIDRDTTPRGSGKLSALLFLPKETTKVQFQLRRQHTAHPIVTSVSEFKVAFINPGKTPLPDHSFPLSSNLAPRISAESSAAKYPKPVITSRTAWGCPDGQNNPRATPSYTTVTHLIVHHTAGSNTASDWAAVVRAIWNFHIFTNGWSDIGYNYLIDPNGVIYEGRAGGDNVIGAHFSCQNSGTMGVAMLGTFTSVQPSTTALNSLKEILSWKADQRSIDPSASTFHNGMQQALQNISGHRDGNGLTRSCTATECPGETFYPLLPNLRTEIKGLVSPINDFTLSTTTDQQFVAKGATVLF